MTRIGGVVDWLLDPEHSDPSIRWQVMRDLLDAPPSEWAAERAKVETEGWGARLLALEDEDGRWGGGTHFPSDFDFDGPEARRGPDGRLVTQPWTATTHALTQLREFGLDPSSERARRAMELIGANARWEEGGQPFWQGEVEPCINGMTVANGAYFGIDVSPDRRAAGGRAPRRRRLELRDRERLGPLVVRHHDQCARGALGVRAGHRRHPRIAGGAPLGRRISAGAGPLPSAQHGCAGRRAIPAVRASEPTALRRAPGARLFPICRAPERRRARPSPPRGDRPRSIQAPRGRHLATRLEPAGAGVVRRQRRPGRTLAVGDSPGDACAQMVRGTSPGSPAARRQPWVTAFTIPWVLTVAGSRSEHSTPAPSAHRHRLTCGVQVLTVLPSPPRVTCGTPERMKQCENHPPALGRLRADQATAPRSAWTATRPHVLNGCSYEARAARLQVPREDLPELAHGIADRPGANANPRRRLRR